MKLAIVALLILCFGIACQAQTIDETPRVLIGPNGGELFSNVFLGIAGRIEVPLGHILELNAEGQISPFEEHIKIGSGWSGNLRTEAQIWFARQWSIDGGVEDSAYQMAGLSKEAPYWKVGITTRRYWLGTPTRISFGYMQEFNNGISKSGLETSDLIGGYLVLDGMISCGGPICFRLRSTVQGGRVLEQGNPQCDRTTCPRIAATAGGGAFTVFFEGRHRGMENSLF